MSKRKFNLATELQEELLNEITDPEAQGEDVVETYAWTLMHGESEVDWPKINDAIIERWSCAELARIKGEAWQQVEEWHYSLGSGV